MNNFTFGFDTSRAAAVGIDTDGAHSGYKFTNNNFAGGVDGVILNTQLDSGAQASTISGNTFSGNDEGVLHNRGHAQRHDARRQYLHTNEKSASILAIGTQLSTNLQFINNQINKGSIVIVDATGSKISGNTITNSTSDLINANIFLGGGVTNTLVQNNSLTAPTTGTAPYGIELATFNPALDADPNTGDTVSGNSVTGLYTESIFLVATKSTSVTSNSLSGAINDGIDLVDEATLTTIANNLSTLNGRDGILLNGSDSNTISNNTTTKNANNGIELIVASNSNTLRNRTRSRPTWEAASWSKKRTRIRSNPTAPTRTVEMAFLLRAIRTRFRTIPRTTMAVRPCSRESGSTVATITFHHQQRCQQ